VSGTFELLNDKLGQFRVLLLSDNREILAASVPFADKAGAVIGIASVREIAGTGLIVGSAGIIPIACGTICRHSSGDPVVQLSMEQRRRGNA
jgi:uncharacterized protein YegP (UPF0339 family)